MDQQNKQNEPQITVSELMKRFPSPQTAIAAAKNGSKTCGGYCVGGALCQALLMIHRFPGNHALTQAIQQANKNLAAYPEVAKAYAEKIVFKNDVGDFKAAWTVLDKALRWVP